MVKLALDRGLSGALEGPSAYLMKSPPVQHHDDIAREMTEAFIQEVPLPTTDDAVKEQANGHKTEARTE